MASGVTIADNVLKFYENMKLQKNTDPVRLATFDFIESSIDVAEVYTQLKLDEANMDGYEFFKSLLCSERCRYILYDCHFNNKESNAKEELVFAMWCPDTAPARQRMNYASSKEALLQKLQGLKHKWQLNDESDILDRNCFAEKLGRGVICVEGVDTRETIVQQRT